MEVREISFIPLKVIEDNIFQTSYLKILHDEGTEIIKLPAHIENYKLKHQLQPHFLIFGELIKTRKNWILKHINSHLELYKAVSYSDFVKSTEITSIIDKYTEENDNCELFEFLRNNFEFIIKSKNKTEIEALILEKLGFLPENNNNKSKYSERINIGKVGNGI